MGKIKHERPTKKWLEQKYINEKLSSKEISEIIGCSSGIVLNWLNKDNIKTRSNIVYDKSIYNKEWLEQKYINEKLCTRQIAEIIGCERHLISKWLKDNDIKLRTYKEVLDVVLNVNNGGMKGKKHSKKSLEKMSKTHRKNDRTIYTKEWLEQKYINEKLSTFQIAKIIGGNRNSISYLLKEYNIKARTRAEGAKLNPPKPTLIRGENHPNWRGGSDLQTQIRSCSKNKNWKLQILKRDDYTCKLCPKRGGKLEIDHIKPLSQIIFVNSITTIEQALECKEIWDITNGRVLCKKCHKNTDSYGGSAIKLLNQLRMQKASKTSSDVISDSITIPSLASHVDPNISAIASDIIPAS